MTLRDALGHHPRPLGHRAFVLGLCLFGSCARETESGVRPSLTEVASRPSPPEPVVLHETIYDGGLASGWRDWGWAPRALGPGPAALDLSNYGGWIIAHPGLTGRFGALSLRMLAPATYGDFLEVRVDSDQQTLYPRVLVRAEHRRPLAGGWVEILVPFSVMNPEDLPFDRVVLRAARPVGSARVIVDKIGLTSAPPKPPAPEAPGEEVSLSIDCRGPGTIVSPLIYGIAYDPMHDGRDRHQWALGATIRRWGGNPASRYNWELGNAWNTANDWFFENVDYTAIPGFNARTFLDDDLEHGVQTALTVPMIGWVAKDTKSFSFPVSSFGPQRAVDPGKPDAGNGVGPDGKPIAPGPPSRTSAPMPPESIGRWIAQIRAEDQRRGVRSVRQYILDNEPMLWNSTHRDVHPEPVTYDELVDRTVRYASAVRAADPDAEIAGPALWGWPAYFFSAKDAAEGFHKKPDRRAHGDKPLLAYYLERLRDHERKTGVRLIDVVDVHFYPQAERVGGEHGGTDARTTALRIRSTRALWDPSYTDESWINDKIQLIPRMKRIIAENYPGLEFSIGEYNFGAERHMSGGLAVAEALGRFAANGVHSAFYWTYPPAESPAFWAFRAYRNFDGQGGRFLDLALVTGAAEGASLFASRDRAGSHIVAILLNFKPDRALRPRMALSGCGAVAKQRAFVYAGAPAGFTPVAASQSGGAVTTGTLPPLSITVLDLELEATP
ncbi:MAG: glycoside hydrolase family 44 protein [Byssovorax sp.]